MHFHREQPCKVIKTFFGTLFFAAFVGLSVSHPVQAAPAPSLEDSTLKISRSQTFRVKPSGEVGVFLLHLGQYPVRLTFPSVAHLNAAFAENLTVSIPLVQLQSLLVVENGSPVTVSGPLSQLLVTRDQTLCGRTLVRAFFRTDHGIPIALDFEKPTNSVSSLVAVDRVKRDHFDECDVFAIGGCGGPECTNIHDPGHDGNPYSVEGACTEVVHSWWFNTCICRE